MTPSKHEPAREYGSADYPTSGRLWTQNYTQYAHTSETVHTGTENNIASRRLILSDFKSALIAIERAYRRQAQRSRDNRYLISAILPTVSPQTATPKLRDILMDTRARRSGTECSGRRSGESVLQPTTQPGHRRRILYGHLRRYNNNTGLTHRGHTRPMVVPGSQTNRTPLDNPMNTSNTSPKNQPDDTHSEKKTTDRPQSTDPVASDPDSNYSQPHGPHRKDSHNRATTHKPPTHRRFIS